MANYTTNCKKKTDCVDVKTIESNFEDINLNVAAKLFKTSSIDEYAAIDSEYLPYASEDEIENITLAAQRSSGSAFRELCQTITRITPVEKRPPVVEKMIAGMDIDKMLARSHTGWVYSVLGREAFEQLHKKQGADGNTIIGNSVYRLDDNDDVQNSDFGYYFDKLNEVNPELLKEVILTMDNDGDIPIFERNNALAFVIDRYKQDSEVVKKIATQKDSTGHTFFHLADRDELETVFKMVDDETLAEALSTKNNYGETAMQTQGSYKEEFAIINDKIQELATDSNLSIEKSISLLKANDMAPQIVEFLELQKAAMDNNQ